MSDPIDELKRTTCACDIDCLIAKDAILALASRLDEAEKRITELELASPCPMLKSICEDWEYDAKPSPDKQEMVERYTELVYPTCLTGRKRIRQILSDFYEEVRRGQS